jgi:diguanylate cyclase (GGDEF)-like protein
MRQRVLIIDDAPEVHELVTTTLASDGVDVVSAYDGPSGVKEAKAIQADLILLDIDMPNSDGFETCRQLKADIDTLAIPIIFLTVVTDIAEKIKGLDLGAMDYVTKPFDQAELRARVRSALRTKHLMDLLAQRAKVDGLTGLWNRSFFEERLDAELALARRTGRPVACIMLDVDHFKRINDRFGHTAGDMALRAVAQVMRANCRIEDVVCRWGGEEFVVLCPNTDCNSAVIAAERLRRVIAASEPRCGEDTIPLTASLGVADIANSGDSSLVLAADKALYEAKNSGRNAVRSIQDIICTLDARDRKGPNIVAAG